MQNVCGNSIQWVLRGDWTRVRIIGGRIGETECINLSHRPISSVKNRAAQVASSITISYISIRRVEDRCRNEAARILARDISSERVPDRTPGRIEGIHAGNYAPV